MKSSNDLSGANSKEEDEEEVDDEVIPLYSLLLLYVIKRLNPQPLKWTALICSGYERDTVKSGKTFFF